MSAASDAIIDCRNHILNNAGPLERMTSACRKGFAEYMNTEISFEGRSETRAWHCANSDLFRTTFTERLSWLGLYAMEAAKGRHARMAKKGDRVRHVVAMELEDMLEGGERVPVGTAGCIP